MNTKDENEAPSKLAAERQVKKFGLFIEEYAVDLRGLKQRRARWVFPGRVKSRE